MGEPYFIIAIIRRKELNNKKTKKNARLIDQKTSKVLFIKGRPGPKG